MSPNNRGRSFNAVLVTLVLLSIFSCKQRTDTGGVTNKDTQVDAVVAPMTAVAKGYLNAEYGYSLSYPIDWKEIPDTVISSVKQASYPDAANLWGVWSPNGALNVLVIILESDGVTPLKSSVNQMLSADPRKPAVVSRTDFTLGTDEAVRCILDTKTPKGESARYEHLYVRHRDFILFVGVGGAPEWFERDRKILSAVLDSVKFVK